MYLPMSAILKPKQVRMNLNEECQAMFAKLCESASDLPESQLATLLITSALRDPRCDLQGRHLGALMTA